MKTLALAVAALVISLTTARAPTVKPGDVITPDHASAVQNSISPGDFLLVKQGMRMKVGSSERLEWPPPYKSATEKYSTQVRLNEQGELANYIADSEGWFITASDQYDRGGKLWKTIATFNAYRDRPVPDARVAIYPFKRMFQTALMDEDVQDGFSTVVYMPGHETEERECRYINMGIVTKSFLDPHQLGLQAH